MNKKNSAKLTLGQKAEKALKEAVRDVIRKHKNDGLPLVVWKDGKVVKIPPQKMKRRHS